jgi:hypothetical protein
MGMEQGKWQEHLKAAAASGICASSKAGRAANNSRGHCAIDPRTRRGDATGER